MASAIGPSAPVFAVDNRDGGTRAFAPINQGPGETAWFGRETPAAIARLEFLRDVGGPMLRQVLDSSGPIDIFALAAQGVQIGDDVHMRTQGTTSLLIRNLLPQIAALPDAGRVDLAQFLSGNHLFFLNLAMAAAKSAATVGRAGRGIEHRHDDVPQRNLVRHSSWPARPRCSSVRHRLSTRRCTTPTTDPRRARATSGTVRSSSWWGSAARQLPARRRSPASCRAGWPTRSAMTEQMASICAAESTRFKLPTWNYRGTPVGVDVRRVVELDTTPKVTTGNPARELRRRPDRCRRGHGTRRVFPRCPAGPGGRRALVDEAHTND